MKDNIKNLTLSVYLLSGLIFGGLIVCIAFETILSTVLGLLIGLIFGAIFSRISAKPENY